LFNNPISKTCTQLRKIFFANMTSYNLPNQLYQQMAHQNGASLGNSATKPNDSSPSASSTTCVTTSVTNPVHGISSSPFNSIASLTNAPSFSSLPNLIGHLSDPNFGTSSDALNFLLNSTDNIQQVTSDVASSNPTNLSFEELFQQHQQQAQKQQQILQVLAQKVVQSHNPSDGDSKLEAPKLENLPVLSQTLAKWGEYQKPHEEIIGQIIQKRSLEKEDYIDVSPYVTFPQHEAARRLGIPSSTLSKKWKDATVNRKWPYRALAKIDKEIATIMHNIPKNADGSLDPEVEQQLAVLLRKRQMEARAVIIRLN